MAKTGNVIYQNLEEYYTNGPNAGQATGVTKPNNSTDTDYVAPVPNSQELSIDCSTGGGSTTNWAGNLSTTGVQFIWNALSTGETITAEMLPSDEYTITTAWEDNTGQTIQKPSWINMTPFKNGNTVLEFSVNSDNTTGAARYANVQITADGVTSLINITQQYDTSTGGGNQQ